MLINMLMLVGMYGGIKQVTILMNLTVTYKFVIVSFRCFVIVAAQCFTAHALSNNLHCTKKTSNFNDFNFYGY